MICAKCGEHLPDDLHCSYCLTRNIVLPNGLTVYVDEVEAPPPAETPQPITTEAR